MLWNPYRPWFLSGMTIDLVCVQARKSFGGAAVFSPAERADAADGITSAAASSRTNVERACLIMEFLLLGGVGADGFARNEQRSVARLPFLVQDGAGGERFRSDGASQQRRPARRQAIPKRERPCPPLDRKSVV